MTWNFAVCEGYLLKTLYLADDKIWTFRVNKVHQRDLNHSIYVLHSLNVWLLLLWGLNFCLRNSCTYTWTMHKYKGICILSTGSRTPSAQNHQFLSLLHSFLISIFISIRKFQIYAYIIVSIYDIRHITFDIRLLDTGIERNFLFEQTTLRALRQRQLRTTTMSL